MLENSELNLLIEKANNLIGIETGYEFNQFAEFFTNKKYEEIRKNIYEKLMLERNLDSLASAKHLILKHVFSDYIQNSLELANYAAEEKDSYKAKSYIDELLKLREIFKNHDVINYKEFITESEPNITNAEVELLFLEPRLDESNIQKLEVAFINAFGKKHYKISSKEDFQKRFFNHPLMHCLDSHKSFSSIVKNIENGNIQLDKYKNLIEVVLKLKEKLNAEEFQGFITFAIKEDITKGFNNIIKDKTYKPEHLQNLLKIISVGTELNNDDFDKTIQEIKINYTKNLALDSEQNLVKLPSSQFALNDYGFDFSIENKEYTFHGHATENSGAGQRGQHANTSFIIRNKTQKDTLGLTVLKNEITRVDHQRTSLRKGNLAHLINMTILEEIIFSGMQFDSYLLKCITSTKNDRTIENLKESNYLNSNHYIIKSQIKESLELINHNIEKNDYDLILEKTNCYFNIFEKNKDFVIGVFQNAYTENYLTYQLMASPIIQYINSILKIEEIYKIKILSDKNINLAKEILTVDVLNIELQDEIEGCLKNIKYREVNELIDINKEQYNNLILLSETNNKKEQFEVSTKIESSDIKKMLLKKTLEECLVFLEEHPIKDLDISKTKKNNLLNLFKVKIMKNAESFFDGYRIDKKDRLLNALDVALNDIKEGDFITFSKTDNVSKNSRFSINYLYASLFSDDKDNEQMKKDTLLLKALLCLAESSDYKINCTSTNLKTALKINKK